MTVLPVLGQLHEAFHNMRAAKEHLMTIMVWSSPCSWKLLSQNRSDSPHDVLAYVYISKHCVLCYGLEAAGDMMLENHSSRWVFGVNCTSKSFLTLVGARS